MRSSQAWAIINQRRRTVADLLAGLDEPDWNRPSLCRDWTIREVAGHLLRERPAVSRLSSRPWFLMSWWSGPSSRSLSAARAAAARPTGAIVADLRSLAGRHHRTESPFWPYVLLEILVHGDDIARPLGRALPMPVDAAEIAATRAWRDREWRATAHRLDGFRLTADDTDWQVGTGPRVSGSMSQLLLLVTGRDAIVSELGGPGRAELAARLGGAT